jgi:hypothetical protein
MAIFEDDQLSHDLTISVIHPCWRTPDNGARLSDTSDDGIRNQRGSSKFKGSMSARIR